MSIPWSLNEMAFHPKLVSIHSLIFWPYQMSARISFHSSFTPVNQILHKFHEDGNSLVYMDPNDLCFAVEEFNYEGLCRAIEQLSDFEKRANSRVIKSGVLKGLNLEDIKRAGEHLILQDGCKGFFQEIVKRENQKTDIHVLSYCWCGDLIRSAFSSREASGTYACVNHSLCKYNTFFPHFTPPFISIH